MVTHMPVEAPEQMHPARSMVVDAAIAFQMTDEDVGYSRFFRDQYPRVVRTIHLIVHDQARAEDISQDAFLALLKDWSRISNYERPDAWVRRIAIRMAVRGLRRDQLFSSLRMHLLPRPVPEPRDLDVAAAVRLLPRLRDALRREVDDIHPNVESHLEAVTRRNERHSGGPAGLLAAAAVIAAVILVGIQPGRQQTGVAPSPGTASARPAA